MPPAIPLYDRIVVEAPTIIVPVALTTKRFWPVDELMVRKYPVWFVEPWMRRVLVAVEAVVFWRKTRAVEVSATPPSPMVELFAWMRNVELPFPPSIPNITCPSTPVVSPPPPQPVQEVTVRVPMVEEGDLNSVEDARPLFKTSKRTWPELEAA